MCLLVVLVNLSLNVSIIISLGQVNKEELTVKGVTILAQILIFCARKEIKIFDNYIFFYRNTQSSFTFQMEL